MIRNNLEQSGIDVIGGKTGMVRNNLKQSGIVKKSPELGNLGKL